jgi:hypothetical protein
MMWLRDEFCRQAGGTSGNFALAPIPLTEVSAWMCCVIGTTLNFQEPRTKCWPRLSLYS